MRLHQTRSEALSPPGGRLQRRVGGILCGLEMMLCPQTVRFKGVAQPVPRARACQGRERGSPRLLSATLAPAAGARAGVQATPRALGEPASAYLGVQRRRPTGQSPLVTGCSPACPVRRQAHLLCSPSPGGTCLAQRRFYVCACHRPPAPAWAPGWARPSPGRVFSPRGPCMLARRDCGAGTTPRPRQRPPGEGIRMKLRVDRLQEYDGCALVL